MAVSQTSTILTTYGLLKVSEYSYCTLTQYAARQTGRVKTVSNDKDSRTLPELPLFLKPTAQPKQEVERRWAGASCSEWYNVNSPNCDNESRRDWTYPLISGTFGLPDEPDWATPMRLKIKSDAVNLGSNIAEYRESVNMFEGFVKGAVTAYQATRGALPRRKRLNWCDLPATHLLSNWGLGPMVDDVEKSVVKLQNRIIEPIYKRIAIKDVETRNRVTWFDQTGWWRKSVRPIAYVDLDVERQPIITGNLGEIIWEGVPASVLLDYVIPIGDWLSALDALKEVTFMIGSITEKEWFSAVKRPELTTFPNNQKLARLKLESHERKIFTDIPLPPFPKWDPSASWKRLHNALSLAMLHSRPCKKQAHYRGMSYTKSGKRVPIVY